MEYIPVLGLIIGFLSNALILVYGLKYQTEQNKLMIKDVAREVDKLSSSIDKLGNFNIDDHSNFTKKFLDHETRLKKHGERIHKLEVHTNIKKE